MRALVLESVGNIGVKEVKEPVCKEGEVPLLVRACGICGSDIPRAYETGAHRMPLIIGHEFCGEYEGKRYGVYPLIPCGRCRQCQLGRYEMCCDYDYLGSRRDGGFAEKVAVPFINLIELPDEVSYEQAAMLEPMAVAVHAMRRVFDCDRESLEGNYGKPTISSAVVIGTGTIGRLVEMFLKDAGVADVWFCDSRIEGDADRILKLTDGMGVEAVFECVGKSESAGLALRLCAPGGRVMLVGNPHGDMVFMRDDYWRILRRQLTVLGTWNSSFRSDWEYAISRVSGGFVHPQTLITHRYTLDNITEGFLLMRDKKEKYCKVMCVTEDV